MQRVGGVLLEPHMGTCQFRFSICNRVVNCKGVGYVRVAGTRCTESTRGAHCCGCVSHVAADGTEWLYWTNNLSALGDVVVVVVVDIIASEVNISCVTPDSAKRLGGLASVGGRSRDVFWP